MMIYQNLKSKI